MKQTQVAADQSICCLLVANWISTVHLLPFQPSCTFCCVFISKENWQPQLSFRECAKVISNSFKPLVHEPL